jgi:glycosyltransferase involved in cell wall biosynthesis
MEGARTGVGRYLEGLLSGIAESDGRATWVLFFMGQPFDHPLWSSPNGRPDGPSFEPVFAGTSGARPVLWEQFRLPRLLRQQRLDLLFSPHYSLPPSPALPSLVTIHDLSFEQLPEEFNWRERWRRRILARQATRRASLVLADTGEIARELRRTYRLEAERVSVVPLAIERKFLEPVNGQDPKIEERLSGLGIRPPYLLYAGTLLARRHIRLLIDVFSKLAPDFPGYSLVLAGANRLRRPRDLAEWVTQAEAGSIVTPGYVDEELLPTLYRNAELSFYLSPHEGFGLPPLESLASGTVAIVAEGLGLDEVWPDYPYRCRELQLESVLHVTREALSNPETRQRVAVEGRRRISQMTWDRSAALFLEEVDRALRP